MAAQLVMYEDDFQKVNAVCDKLTRDANANLVLLVDKNGQLVSATGYTQNVDTTSLASLIAGNVAAMGGLAKLIGENDFPQQFHQGAQYSIGLSTVASRVVLVVIYDKRTSEGLVRLRIKKATEELNKVFEGLAQRAPSFEAHAAFAEITDADIDNLFSE